MDPSTTTDALLSLYECFAEKYNHPFFVTQLGLLYKSLDADSLALKKLESACEMCTSSCNNVPDLARFIDMYKPLVEKQVQAGLEMSRNTQFYQKWRPTQYFVYRFPDNLQYLPGGSNNVLSEWGSLKSKGFEYFERYLMKLSIETNHLESTFLLTEASAIDLIKRGISHGTVHWLPDSALQSPQAIRSAISDILAAYKLVQEISLRAQTLTKDTLCNIHGILMKSSRISPEKKFLSLGVTRSATRKTVLVQGSYAIECCPFEKVDSELEEVVKATKGFIKVKNKNPFATSSWIHLALVRCHPFDDGNGRLARLVASIPLIKAGYPPISIGMDERRQYYDAINKAYEGDHFPFVRCLVMGMQRTIQEVKSL